MKPTKEDQIIARQSYQALSEYLVDTKRKDIEIEIVETGEKVKVPFSILKLFGEILKETGNGNMISIVTETSEITTQAAAEYLGCSRPHVVKILEEGKIPYSKVGKHRRIKYNDIVNYKSKMKNAQKSNLKKLMDLDQESGLYDT